MQRLLSNVSGATLCCKNDLLMHLLKMATIFYRFYFDIKTLAF